MGSFHLLWIIISAIYVSCQELNISLPEGNDACARREVTFTCTIRGSPNLTSLILAWSSPEYIGNPLRFVSVDTRGTNITSMINGNVTAILTSNTMIDGVPVLVSELHIVGANQRSMITCESVTNESSMSKEISIPALPGQPTNVGARHLSAGSCDFLGTWDPPINIIDRSNIDRYIVYVPLRNITKVEFSTTTVLNVSNCRDGDIISIRVAAVNSVGCEGLNSTAIELNLLEMPTISVDTQMSAIIAGAVVGSILFVIIFVIVTVVIIVGYYYYRRLGKKQKLINDQISMKLIDQMKDQDEFRMYLAHLLVILNSKFSSISAINETVGNMIEILKRTSSPYIKEALLRALNNIVWERDCQYVKKALVKLTKLIPDIKSIFDEKLKVANVTISNESDDSEVANVTISSESDDSKVTVLTVDNLIVSDEVGSDRFRRVFLDTLIPAVKKEKPDSVKELLQEMCSNIQLQAKRDKEKFKKELSETLDRRAKAKPRDEHYQETNIDSEPRDEVGRDEHQEALHKLMEKVSLEQAKDLLLEFIDKLEKMVTPDGAISPRKRTANQSNGRV